MCCSHKNDQMFYESYDIITRKNLNKSGDKRKIISIGIIDLIRIVGKNASYDDAEINDCGLAEPRLSYQITV